MSPDGALVQAVVVSEHGGPEVLRPEEVHDPEPGPDDVVVELRAAALNRRFCLVTVAEMLNEPVAHLLPLLDEAIDAGLVVSDGVEPEFRSILLWQVIRASLPAYLRTALHQQAAGRPAASAARQDPVLARLGEKERTIAQLAAEGLTNQQIARRVFLSPHTVNYHMRRIFRKLAVTSRIELARLVAASRSLT